MYTFAVLLLLVLTFVIECLFVVYRLGLDPKVLSNVLNMSSGRSWSSDTYNPCPGVIEGVPSSRDYEGGFGTALMAKVHTLSLLYCLVYVQTLCMYIIYILIILYSRNLW